VRLAGLWRHPVKSFQGEPVGRADVEPRGLVGDREWGVQDPATGKVLTGRLCPELLLAEATIGDDGQPIVRLPTGATCRGIGSDTDAGLSEWLGHPVSLVVAASTPPARAEYFADATDDSSAAIEWTMPAGKFVDVTAVSVLTTASLRAAAVLHPAGDWHLRRFRPNFLIETDDEGWVEDAWSGRVLRVGDVELKVVQPCVRCTIVTRPQPGLLADLDTFRTLARHHGATFGVWANVRTPGTVHLGDAVELA
jgi:MOSC domain-containing protein